MRRITHVMDLENMRDLLERAPRACIAFNDAGRVELVPVDFRFQKGRYWVGLSGAGCGPAPGADKPVKLLIDEGMYYFDMRGVWIRGRAFFGEERPEGGPSALNWFQLLPDKFVAWDFGAMRKATEQ